MNANSSLSPSIDNDVPAVRLGSDRWGFVFDVLKENWVETVQRELSWFFGARREPRLKGAPKIQPLSFAEAKLVDRHRAAHGTPHPLEIAAAERFGRYVAYLEEWRRTHPIEARRLKYSFSRLHHVVPGPAYSYALRGRFSPLLGEQLSLKKISRLGWDALGEALGVRSSEYSQRFRSYIA